MQIWIAFNWITAPPSYKKNATDLDDLCDPPILAWGGSSPPPQPPPGCATDCTGTLDDKCSIIDLLYAHATRADVIDIASLQLYNTPISI